MDSLSTRGSELGSPSLVQVGASMSTAGSRNGGSLMLLGGVCAGCVGIATLDAAAQAQLGPPCFSPPSAGPLAPLPISPPSLPPGPPTALALPTPSAAYRPLPINLPTALRLANVRPLDVAVASQRIELALGQL